jgi:hypothetical protein
MRGTRAKKLRAKARGLTTRPTGWDPRRPYAMYAPGTYRRIYQDSKKEKK